MYHRKRHQEHPEYKRKWYLEHADQMCAHLRKLRQENPEPFRAKYRKWRQENPEKRRALEHKRRARIKGNGGSYTVEELHDLWHKQNGFCYYCGELLYKTLNSVYHIEHKIPISKGGSNDISNIALSCAECNFRKHDKTDEEFLEVLNNR